MAARREIHPGDRLRELDLTERFGVSRGRIREALSSLEASGIVKIEPRRGATLTRLSDAEVIDAFDIGSELIVIAARRAAERGTIAQKSALLKAAEELAESAERLTPDQHLHLATRMIRQITGAAHNPQLASMIETIVLTGPGAVFSRLGVSKAARRRQAAANWLAAAKAIEACDSAAAGATLRKISAQALKAIRSNPVA
jgi:DNA-binding GntR family transcriptional regulator